MSGTPTWISVVQLLLTGLLGLGAAAIAFMQWRTAHQKVVLDLFEKRIEVIMDLKEIVVSFNDTGIRDREKILSVSIRLLHLFGDEASLMMSELVQNINEARAIDRGDPKNVERIKLLGDATKAARPYLLMNQKVIRTPAQWLRDRNKLRKSYEDQPAP